MQISPLGSGACKIMSTLDPFDKVNCWFIEISGLFSTINLQKFVLVELHQNAPLAVLSDKISDNETTSVR